MSHNNPANSPAEHPTSTPASKGDSDPVLSRRREIGRLAQRGKRLGYSLFVFAMVVFVIGFFTSFNGAVVWIVALSLVVGSAVLAPALVMGYGVRAADREDRTRENLSRESQ